MNILGRLSIISGKVIGLVLHLVKFGASNACTPHERFFKEIPTLLGRFTLSDKIFLLGLQAISNDNKSMTIDGVVTIFSRSHVVAIIRMEAFLDNSPQFLR